MVIGQPGRPVIMEEVTDPEELAAARVRREQFDRNVDWLQAHADDVYEANRGKNIVIAGQQVFAADEPEDAWALVETAGIQDSGSFIMYVPKEKMLRIYVHRG